MDYPITQQSVEVLTKMNEKLTDIVYVLFTGVQAAPEHPICKAAVMDAKPMLDELKKLKDFALLLCVDTSEVPARRLRIVDGTVEVVEPSE